MPTLIHDYRPGRATIKGVPQDRPSYDVLAVFPEEADEFFGTKGQAERVDWVRYLYERGILLKTHPSLYLSQLKRGTRPRRAYLLLRPEHQVPRKRPPRPPKRVFHW